VVSNNEKRETHERVKKQRRTLFCLFDERSEEKSLPKIKRFLAPPRFGVALEMTKSVSNNERHEGFLTKSVFICVHLWLGREEKQLERMDHRAQPGF
jgi:hypothetical protein